MCAAYWSRWQEPQWRSASSHLPSVHRLCLANDGAVSLRLWVQRTLFGHYFGSHVQVIFLIHPCCTPWICDDCYILFILFSPVSCLFGNFLFNCERQRIESVSSIVFHKFASIPIPPSLQSPAPSYFSPRYFCITNKPLPTIMKCRNLKILTSINHSSSWYTLFEKFSF